MFPTGRSLALAIGRHSINDDCDLSRKKPQKWEEEPDDQECRACGKADDTAPAVLKLA
jgi:hypothetical protein